MTQPAPFVASGPGDVDAPSDWTVPTDYDTLRARVLPVPDQSRYGTATEHPDRV